MNFSNFLCALLWDSSSCTSDVVYYFVSTADILLEKGLKLMTKSRAEYSLHVAVKDVGDWPPALLCFTQFQRCLLISIWRLSAPVVIEHFLGLGADKSSVETIVVSETDVNLLGGLVPHDDGQLKFFLSFQVFVAVSAHRLVNVVPRFSSSVAFYRFLLVLFCLHFSIVFNCRFR